MDSKDRELLLISKKGDKEKLLELLSSKQVNINFQNENGWSALHFACDEGNLKIVDILIKSKINYYSTGIHFGPLFCQPKDRCLNYNPKYNKDRFLIQIKWYSIFDDYIEYKNTKCMEEAEYVE